MGTDSWTATEAELRATDAFPPVICGFECAQPNTLPLADAAVPRIGSVVRCRDRRKSDIPSLAVLAVSCLSPSAARQPQPSNRMAVGTASAHLLRPMSVLTD